MFRHNNGKPMPIYKMKKIREIALSFKDMDFKICLNFMPQLIIYAKGIVIMLPNKNIE